MGKRDFARFEFKMNFGRILYHILRNAGKKWAVLVIKYRSLWPWYHQFEVGLLQPPQFLSGTVISLVTLVLVSRDTNLYYEEKHPA